MKMDSKEEVARKEMEGIKELTKLSPEEREYVYNRLREKGASEKSIETMKQWVDARNEIERWFKRGGNKDKSRR